MRLWAHCLVAVGALLSTSSNLLADYDFKIEQIGELSGTTGSFGIFADLNGSDVQFDSATVSITLSSVSGGVSLPIALDLTPASATWIIVESVAGQDPNKGAFTSVGSSHKLETASIFGQGALTASSSRFRLATFDFSLQAALVAPQAFRVDFEQGSTLLSNGGVVAPASLSGATFAAVPEPSSLCLLGAAGVFLVSRGRRR